MNITMDEAVRGHWANAGHTPGDEPGYDARRCDCGYMILFVCQCGIPMIMLTAGSRRCAHAEAIAAGCFAAGYDLAVGRATRWTDVAA